MDARAANEGVWSRHAAFTASLLVMLVAIAFYPCLQNDFVNWDDNVNFLENASYRGLGWAQLRWDWTSFQIGVYQPLAWMILGAQYLLFGLKPWGYHFTGLILHALNTVVLFVLTLSLLTRCHSAREPKNPRLLVLAAGLAVALFAVHPLRTEVVSWASCQPYLPCTLFSMLAVLAYLHAFRAGQVPSSGWMVAAFALFAAALLCKAAAVTLPAVFLILDVYPLGRLGGGPGRWCGPEVRRVWWEKSLFGALSLVFMGLAVVGRVENQHLVSYRQSGIAARLSQACYGILFYLIKTVLPTNITALYPVPERVVWFDAPFVWCVLGTLGMSVALFLLHRRWPGLLAAWLTYLVILAPTLGLIRIGSHIAADRYSYIAMMSGVVLLAAGLSRVLHTRSGVGLAGWGLSMAGLAVLLGLIVLTQSQCRTWRTSETLWTHVLTHGGNRSDIAHNNLGLELQRQGRGDEARAHIELAVRINPDSVDAHINLGSLLRDQGQFDEARAQFDDALRINPASADAVFALGVLLLRQGRIDEARTQLDETLRINPNFAKAYNNRAMIRATAADAKYRDGPRAVEDATHACALTDWKNAGFLDTLAAAHAEAADFERAVKWQTAAIELLTDENQKADFRSRLELYHARRPYHEPIAAR